MARTNATYNPAVFDDLASPLPVLDQTPPESLHVCAGDTHVLQIYLHAPVLCIHVLQNDLHCLGTGCKLGVRRLAFRPLTRTVFQPLIL
jgi:hypothetical protein